MNTNIWRQKCHHDF